MANLGANGEFHFTMREKVDRNGNKYLFAGIPMFNSILFVRPDPRSTEMEPRWLAVLKPYTGPREDRDTDGDPWK